MSTWAIRDARRLINRVHYISNTHGDLSQQENSYLRGQVALLLLGPMRDELLNWQQDCLRGLLEALEHHAGREIEP